MDGALPEVSKLTCSVRELGWVWAADSSPLVSFIGNVAADGQVNYELHYRLTPSSPTRGRWKVSYILDCQADRQAKVSYATAKKLTVAL